MMDSVFVAFTEKCHTFFLVMFAWRHAPIQRRVACFVKLDRFISSKMSCKGTIATIDYYNLKLVMF